MDKIIKYLNESEIPIIVKFITQESNKDVCTVITQIEEGMAVFNKKAQEILNELYKNILDYKVGMIVEAQEDCLNNFKKGQRLDITAVSDEGIRLESLVTLEEKWIRKHFKVVGMRDCL